MNTLHSNTPALRQTSSNEHGFTLIELLVVIALLAVLPGLLIPAIQKAREAYSANEAAAGVNQLSIASQEYRNRTGSYLDRVDDLIGWNFTPLDPEVAQGKKNGYLYEIVEADQDHCRIETRPEFPGITGSLTMGAVVTRDYNHVRTYQIISAGADRAKERMINNISAKAAETVVRLLRFDNSATPQVRSYVESPDALHGVLNTLDGDDDGSVSVEEMLTSSSAIPDTELRGPVEEFLAYVAAEMKLDSLSVEAKRSIAVGVADLHQGHWLLDVTYEISPLFSYDGICLPTKLWINQPDISNSLCANLETAEASGDLRGRNRLITSYQSQVRSQIGEAIAGGDAKRLITLAGVMGN